MKIGDYVEGVGSVGINKELKVKGIIVSISTVLKSVLVKTGESLYNVLRIKDIKNG